MKKKGKDIIIAFLLLLVFFSCSDEKITNPGQKSAGGIQFVIKKENIPSNIFLIEVSLSREGFGSIIKNVVVDDSFEDLISINSISVGLWDIVINAKDELGVVKYTGESSVEILENQTMLLSITLQPVQGTTSVGSLIITINWGSEGLPDNWEYFENNPIVTNFGSVFDARGVTIPFVLKDNNGFKMWYAAFPSETGGKMYIFYAHSQDGLNWQRHSYLPVLFPGEPGSWDDGHIGEPVVIKIQDQYVMYYGGFRAYENNNWNIGRAVSNDGINWQKDNEPVFYGSQDEWDQIISPQSVIAVNNKYYMYYSGRNGNQSTYSIGLAISNDGINWNRSTQNPILIPSHTWEGSGVYYPDVHKNTDGNFIMYYMNAFTNQISFGRAYSQDGIVWNKDPANPYMTTQSFLNVNLEKVAYPRYLKLNNNSELFYFTEFDINANKTINVLIKNNNN